MSLIMLWLHSLHYTVLVTQGLISIMYNICEQDNDLSEFDESRDIIESLVDEYKACESPDYIKWGMEVIVLLASTSVCSFPTSIASKLFFISFFRILPMF